MITNSTDFDSASAELKSPPVASGHAEVRSSNRCELMEAAGGDYEIKKNKLRFYSDVLTAEVNRKGVLDIDVVKGCTEGIKARNGTGCYGGCYAANIAKFRGIDFSKSVTRYVKSKAHAREIELAVKNSPVGFFRIGTMGDPSHAWKETVETVEWLAPFSIPVIITKHWHIATDDQFARLVACGAVLNTSISALDTDEELAHREAQISRYAILGGISISRIVSCDFNRKHPEGRRMAEIQDRLFKKANTLDNPLRVRKNHYLHTSGIIKLKSVLDLQSVRTISVLNSKTHIGHCAACPDKCGLSLCGTQHPRPTDPQLFLI